MIVIGLTGCEGGELSKQATVSVIVPLGGNGKDSGGAYSNWSLVVWRD